MERIEEDGEPRHRSPRIRRLGMSLGEITIHEAAHATIAWILGRRVLGVSMVTDSQFRMLRRHSRHGISLGCTCFTHLSALSPVDRHYRLLAEREAMIGLA